MAEEVVLAQRRWLLACPIRDELCGPPSGGGVVPNQTMQLQDPVREGSSR